MKFADAAMYQAGQRGRKRLLRFTGDMWTNDENY